MKFIKVTEEEINSIWALRDGFTLDKNSPYRQDLENVDALFNREMPGVDMDELMKLCRTLMESGEMTRDAFKKIRAWKQDTSE